MPISFRESIPRFLSSINDVGRFASARASKEFLYGRVSFRTENFVADCDPEKLSERYDTIVCLSTIKWVHLNWGDVGVKALFHKAFHLLTQGGLFILEPQEWRSYKKRKGLSETIAENFKRIALRPLNFKDYLV